MSEGTSGHTSTEPARPHVCACVLLPCPGHRMYSSVIGTEFGRLDDGHVILFGVRCRSTVVVDVVVVVGTDG